MKLERFIRKTVRQFLNENTKLVDEILDKINRNGKESLSADEKDYLKQYSDSNVNEELEEWLLSDDENTFSKKGEKLLYDEFEDDEDIFRNQEKLKRIITKHLNKKPFTNNSDWGGALVWNVKSNSNFEGEFFYLGDDELILLKRKLVDDEYEDEVIKDITTSKELYSSLKSAV
jgi:hypothetical protein